MLYEVDLPISNGGDNDGAVDGNGKDNDKDRINSCRLRIVSNWSSVISTEEGGSSSSGSTTIGNNSLAKAINIHLATIKLRPQDSALLSTGSSSRPELDIELIEDSRAFELRSFVITSNAKTAEVHYVDARFGGVSY